MNKEEFSWIPFYMELADKLKTYVSHRFYLITFIKDAYKNINLPLPKLDYDGKFTDIDPFTIFGLFNKGISTENRKLIDEEFKRKLNIQSSVPDRYDGIPVLNNLNATFYQFAGNRGEHDIDQLWNVFLSAIDYADKQNDENLRRFCDAYNSVKDLKGNRWKITMGLYWIRPYTYMNLDSCNRRFLTQSGNMPADFIALIKDLTDIPEASTYLELCKKAKKAMSDGNYAYTSFPALSSCAWEESEKVNKENKLNDVANGDDDSDTLDQEDNNRISYWLYSPGENAAKWDEYYKAGIMAIGWGEIGDLENFNSKDEIKQRMKEHFGSDKNYKNAGHATWQFVHDIKIGDVVFVKKGRNSIIGKGIVKSVYRYDPKVQDGYKNIRDVDWTNKGDWPHPGQAVLKTLTDITPYTDYVTKLNALFESEEDTDTEDTTEYAPKYGKTDFLKDVFITEEQYHKLVDVLKYKKNVILEGAPGVGKTFCAKRLAYSIIGCIDDSRVRTVQFHQSYSYEDFIMGYRPTDKGYEMHYGAFYTFCKEAEKDDPQNPYFFVIDEINRGNISKVFGELFMLIEADKREKSGKRGKRINLLYNDEQFSVPENVYIIGTMNTADRSLAMMDYALRRRFAFFNIPPAFDNSKFIDYINQQDSEKLNRLVSCVKSLNEAIREDPSLGEGVCIGHSYFCPANKPFDDNMLHNIVEYELIPLLKEYWYDEPEKVREWSEKLRSALQ